MEATDERKKLNKKHLNQVINWWLKNKAPKNLSAKDVKDKVSKLNDKEIETIMYNIYPNKNKPSTADRIGIKKGYIIRITDSFSGKSADAELNKLILGLTGEEVKEDKPKEEVGGKQPKEDSDEDVEYYLETSEKVNQLLKDHKLKKISDKDLYDFYTKYKKEIEEEKLKGKEMPKGYLDEDIQTLKEIEKHMKEFNVKEPVKTGEEGEEVEVEVPVKPKGRKKVTREELEKIALDEYVKKVMEETSKTFDLKLFTDDELVKLDEVIRSGFRDVPTAFRNPMSPYEEFVERAVGKKDVSGYKIGAKPTTTTTAKPETTTTTTTTTEKKQEHRSPSFREGLKAEAEAKVETKPIELPVNYKFKDEELKERNEEGGWQMNRQNKGTQRPKFITPSVNVLQPSEQAKQAQYDEWAIFDFVKPEEEGASGNLGNNPLKRMVDTEHETIMRNAGIDLDPALSSVFKDRMIDTNQEQLKADMLPPLMPDTSKEPRQVYDVSEYEVKSYDVNNDRTAIEMASPYDNMTPIVLTNEEVRKSILYGRVP